jgi:hypothetical protein
MSTLANAMMIVCGHSRYRLPALTDASAAISIDNEIARIEISGSELHLFEVLPAAGNEAFLTGVYRHWNFETRELAHA